MTAAVVPMSGARGVCSPRPGRVGHLGLERWPAVHPDRAPDRCRRHRGRRGRGGGVSRRVLGVQSRFANAEETQGRYVQTAATSCRRWRWRHSSTPPSGIGTGMMQNARQMLQIPARIEVEAEVGRYLAELGPVGFLLSGRPSSVCSVALVTSDRILKRAGRRGAAAAALSYAFLTMIGNLAFDHIWQALYFLGCGSILAEVVSVLRERAAAARRSPPVPEKRSSQHESSNLRQQAIADALPAKMILIESLCAAGDVLGHRRVVHDPQGCRRECVASHRVREHDVFAVDRTGRRSPRRASRRPASRFPARAGGCCSACSRPCPSGTGRRPGRRPPARSPTGSAFRGPGS